MANKMVDRGGVLILYITMAAMSLWDGGGGAATLLFYFWFNVGYNDEHIFVLFGLWHEICGHK